MSNKTKWDQLSLSQKAGLIKIYVNNGFSDIDSIREDYNKNVENFQSNDANFVQRLRDNDSKYVQNADGSISTHKLNYATNDNGAIIYPSVQEHNGTLVDHSEDNMGGIESAIQHKDTVRTSIPFAEWYTKNYKKDYSEFFNRYNKFKDGGFGNNKDKQQNNNEQRLITKDSLYNYINTDKRKSTWKKQGFNGWTDSDLDYLYEKLNTTGWDERAVLYAIDKETNFRTHVKNPVSSAIGLAQLTKAQMKTLFGDNADKVYEEYLNGTRSVKDVIDDTIAQYKWMHDRIKSEKENMGYGRIKVNLLAPNASLDSIISNNLYENSLTPLQKLKIKKGKSTYRDLMTMYDEEFKNNFK